MKKIYLIATIVAIITGFTVYMFANDLKEKSLMAKADMIPVVVASADIGANTILKYELLTTVLLPKSSISESVIQDVSEVVGKTTKFPLTKGEQVLLNKIVQIGKTDNDELPDRIKAGYRAFTIAVDEITGVAGYLKKGDKVDIIASRTVNNLPTTTLLLQNINIIAVGNKPASAEQTATSYTNITVEIPSSECIRLNHEIVNGFVKIILRGIGDENIENVQAASN